MPFKDFWYNLTGINLACEGEGRLLEDELAMDGVDSLEALEEAEDNGGFGGNETFSFYRIAPLRLMFRHPSLQTAFDRHLTERRRFCQQVAATSLIGLAGLGAALQEGASQHLKAKFAALFVGLAILVSAVSPQLCSIARQKAPAGLLVASLYVAAVLALSALMLDFSARHDDGFHTPAELLLLPPAMGLLAPFVGGVAAHVDFLAVALGQLPVVWASLGSLAALHGCV
eukprot:CAMPEP_0194720812 /NCGR_PEP_ID=MMETSP0296-20130528/12124_1 /TAXON_ID=39354 /ORGANISM="Heterosigma akashiwo, Strain CCMP2393" /LENGTH=228 /DNA_ID=CAMNT_0039623149 /DNA_START=69 /DNA_END=751 /DNA_ORIENTATION=-